MLKLQEHPDFQVYSTGLVAASVCSSLPIEKITEKLNQCYPTGIASKWELSEDKFFADGTTMPCQCSDYPNNKHYLFNC